jgi:hypothetical protein
MAQYIEYCKTLVIFYPGLLALRFFRVFSFQPRLALITKTLEISAVDLFHFGFVFVSVFMTYAVMGMCLFGFEVAEFSTVYRAWFTTYRIMMNEIDFDWTPVAKVGVWQSMLWFYGFRIVVALMLLNMFIAIILDTYMEVKGRIGASAETLWSQVAESSRRYRQWMRGKRMSLPEVKTALAAGIAELDKDPGARTRGEMGSRVVTVEGFQALVPQIGSAQAERLLADALLRKEDDVAQVSMTDTFKLVKKIEDDFDYLHVAIRFQDTASTWISDAVTETHETVAEGRMMEDTLTMLCAQHAQMLREIAEFQRQQTALGRIVNGLLQDRGTK